MTTLHDPAKIQADAPNLFEALTRPLVNIEVLAFEHDEEAGSLHAIGDDGTAVPRVVPLGNVGPVFPTMQLDGPEAGKAKAEARASLKATIASSQAEAAAAKAAKDAKAKAEAADKG